LHLDTVGAVEGCSSSKESDSGAGLLVTKDLDVCQACRVIDADVYELPASAACVAGLAAITGYAMPDMVYAPELLHIAM
jgi:hypothetical protein